MEIQLFFAFDLAEIMTFASYSVTCLPIASNFSDGKKFDSFYSFFIERMETFVPTSQVNRDEREKKEKNANVVNS